MPLVRLLACSVPDSPSLALSDGGNLAAFTVDPTTLPAGSLTRSALIAQGGGPTFVFRPNGVAAGNVYTDWTLMMADVANQPGPKWIEIDGSLATANVPAGSWNVDDCTFQGVSSFGSAASTLHFLDGAHFTFARLTLDMAVRFDSAALTPVAVPAAGSVIFVLRSSSINTSSAGSAPWLQCSNANIAIVIDDLASVTGAAPAITVDAARTCNVFVLNDSRLANNVVIGAGALTVLYADDSTVGLTQTVATVTGVMLSIGSQIKYTPAVAGNWQPVPTQASAALDQLAATNVIAEVNAAPTAPGGTTSYTSAATIAKKRSGRVRVTINVTLTANGNGLATMQLFRDTTATLLPPLADGTVSAAIVNGTQLSLTWIDTLPDLAAHAYGFTATTSVGAISAAAARVSVSADEL